MKKLLVVLILLLLILAGGGYYLVANINDVIVSAVNTYGPELTMTEVHLDKAEMDLLSGRGVLHGLSIGNPKGFEGKAVEIGSVSADVDVSTILKDVLVIRSIAIDAPRISLMTKGRSINLKVLLDNIEKAAEGPKEERRPEANADDGPASKKVIIDDFRICGTQASIALPILNISRDVTLSDIYLTGIGRKSDGATCAEVARQLLGVLLGKLAEEQVADALGPGGRLLLLLTGVSSKSSTDDVRVKAAGSVLKHLFGNRNPSE